MGAYLCDDVCREVVANTMHLSREFVPASMWSSLDFVSRVGTEDMADLRILGGFCDSLFERIL